MSLYQAGALALIIAGAVAVLIYAGAIIAEVVKYKVRQRRFVRRFER